MLNKKQKNVLFELINDTGLDISEFSLTEGNEFRITHNPTEYYIRFIPTEVLFNGSRIDAIQILCTPDNSKLLLRPKQERNWGAYKNWNEVMVVYSDWLKLIKEELGTPDLWAEAAKTAQLFAGTAEASDDKFTRTELAEVQAQLRQLQQSFAASALPEAAKQKLIELTQVAAVAAETKTKRDWVGIIVGNFTGAIISLSLNPTQASEVLKLVKAVFGGLFLN